MVDIIPPMLRPITIGHVTCGTASSWAMHTRLETRDNPVERMAAFMAARAEGEVGLILTESHPPTPEGRMDPESSCSMTPRTSTNTASSGRRPRRRRRIVRQILRAGRYAKVE